MFEPSGIVSAIDGLGEDLIKGVDEVKESLDERLEGFDFGLLFDALKTISEQLEQQTNILKMLVELH